MSVPVCCEYQCTTLFCPHCGKETNTHPLDSLLRHINVRIKQYENNKARVDRLIARKGGTNQEITARLERNAKQREKWEAWYRKLEELIAMDNLSNRPPKTQD